MALSLSTSSSHSAHYIKNAIKNYIPISSSISRSNILQEEKEKERMISDVPANNNDNDCYLGNNIKSNGYTTTTTTATNEVALNNKDAQLNERLLPTNNTERHIANQDQLYNGHNNNFTGDIVSVSPNVYNQPLDGLTITNTPNNQSEEINCVIVDDVNAMQTHASLETKLIDSDANNNNNHYEEDEHIKTGILEIPSVIIHNTSDIYDPTKTIVCYHNNHNTNVYNDTTTPVATTPMRLNSDSQDDEENGEKKRSKLKLRKKLSPAELAKRRQRKKSNKNCKIFFYTAIASSCFLFLYLIYHSLFT